MAAARHRRGSTVSALALALALQAAAACGPELPSSQRIATTRILAIRNEVTETLPIGPPEDTDALGVRCQALPFELVQLTPWLVDPEKVVDPADTRPIWIACELPPGQGLFACLKGAMPLKLGDLEDCPQLSLLELDPEALADGELPDFPSPCRIPDDGTDDGLQDFRVPLTQNVLIGGSIEITMISETPAGAPWTLSDEYEAPEGPPPASESCANTLLSGETQLNDYCIQAVQRLTVGPTERLIELASAFGVELPAEFPTADEIPDGDRNPRITSFSLTVEHEDGSSDAPVELARGDVVEVSAGDRLLITTEAPESDLQEYLVPINGGRDGYETRTEAYDGRWFRTWGELLSSVSNDPMSRNEWTMIQGGQDESEPLPPEDQDGRTRATLFYVLRDGRQGVDWWWFHADVSE